MRIYGLRQMLVKSSFIYMYIYIIIIYIAFINSISST